MKKHLFTLLLVTLALGTLQASPFGVSARDGWYFTAKGGIDVMGNRRTDTSAPLATWRNDENTGGSLALAAGYSYSNFRFELEYAYRRNSINFSTPALPNTSGHASYNSLMTNLLYDLYFTRNFYWYNGFGLGVASVNLNIGGLGENSSTRFAWQLMTGLGYHLTDALSLNLGYRLFTTANYRSDIGASSVRYRVPYHNIFEFGIRYHF